MNVEDVSDEELQLYAIPGAGDGDGNSVTTAWLANLALQARRERDEAREQIRREHEVFLEGLETNARPVPCHICGEATNNLSAFPGKWRHGMGYHGGQGKIRYYCNSCLMTAVYTQQQTTAVLQEWIDKQGEARCWWFPELLQRLADIHGIVPIVAPALPDRETFERGCKRYQDEQYNQSAQ